MGTWKTGKLRRSGLAALLAAALTVSAAACGGDESAKEKGGSPSASSENQGGEKGGEGEGKTLPDTSKVIATLKGDEGIEMVLHSVVRDAGGFLTVSGEFKNNGSSRYTTPVQWSGEEQAVARTGRSVAAMTLVDSKEKKRYYVLRDTDNRPLTTSGYQPAIDAGESLPFFAQFPAPPSDTTEVSLQFPGFPNAPIEIS
ncbi:hypothetical protein L7D48_13300 [Streptomyces sp. S1A]|uniref:hypothetical protein n=1 Tax=Streptomyces sp. ICN903 TaxID=2964654 RepID=UPI001EDC9235|nr:hypothetical protein [Streptomyces sp. ICN903]MCG3041525.1 hypothetical protein [Streptomyces sp. ICN903]